jgi:hypothetical protein
MFMFFVVDSKAKVRHLQIYMLNHNRCQCLPDLPIVYSLSKVLQIHILLSDMIELIYYIPRSRLEDV